LRKKEKQSIDIQTIPRRNSESNQELIYNPKKREGDTRDGETEMRQMKRKQKRNRIDGRKKERNIRRRKKSRVHDR
jgi:hypothetical protein